MDASGGDASVGGNATGGFDSAGGNVAGGTSSAPGSETGGTSSTQVIVATGGSDASGGASTGGSESTGGAIATGGVASMGGTFATGGSESIGGASATGGGASTGGAMATGGAIASGGITATGGYGIAGAAGGWIQAGGATAIGGQISFGGTPDAMGGSGFGGKPDMGTTGGGPAIDGGPGTEGDAGDGCTVQGITSVISGLIKNNSSYSGRVYLRIAYTDNSRAPAGTSLFMNAGDELPYAIHVGGEHTGDFTLEARLDTTHTAVPSRVNPAATQSIRLDQMDLNVPKLELISPTIAVPPAPSIGVATPTPDGVIVSVKNVVDADRIDYADEYRVYYTSDIAGGPPSPSHKEGVVYYSLDTNAVYIPGLTPGKDYQFAATAVAGAFESAPSVARTVNVGAPSSGYSVSGIANLAGIATTPNSKLLSVLYSASSGIAVSVTAASPNTDYTVQGVASGTYRHMAFLDLNGDGRFTATEPHADYDSASLVEVHSNTSGADYALASSAVVARVITSHSGEGYGLNFEVYPNQAMPARVALCAGPHVSTPNEMGIESDGNLRFSSYVPLPQGAVPAEGDSYRFKVILADDTVQLYDAKVTGVLSASINLVSPTGDVRSVTPTFTWSTAGTLPAVYSQDLFLMTTTGGEWEIDQMGPSVRSIAYNADGSAVSSQLTLNTNYSWALRLRDTWGNVAESNWSVFTPVP